MAKTNEDLLGRPLYVYDLPSQVLDSLTLKTDVTADSEVIRPPDTETTDRPSSPGMESNASSDTAVGSQACSLCGLSFATVLDQRGHLKSDLHHYNLKQKLRGKKPVTEHEFEKLVEHLDESLSGSDDDDSDEDEHDGRQDTTLTALLRRQAKLGDKAKADDDEEEDETKIKPKPAKEPLLWFSSPLLPENRYFGLYRALFTGEQQRNPDVVEELKKKQLQPVTIPNPGADGKLVETAYTGPHIFLCMIGGGHFAAMVVALPPRATKHGNTPMNREATVLAHKTFHRYTTRRKQGGSQSANDNAKGAAHSAGSTLRRYNEQALIDDIRALLQDWKALIDTSELLFVRATGMTNRRTLYGPYDGQVLKHNDTRLRAFPFTTKRATQNELMRSFIELTRFKVREIVPRQESKPGSGTHTPSKSASQKPAKPKLSEEEQNALLHTSQIQALTRRSKLPALLSYLKTNDVPVDFEFAPPEPNHHAPRPLHFAASQNSAPLVSGLLIKAGANPTLKNADGKTAFELAGDRATRDAFRVARSELGEVKWEWEVAKVPSAMTKAEADRRDKLEKQDADQKESERRKAEEERLRKEGPQVQDKKPGRGQMLAAASVKTAQEKREEEARGLTPEMKMRLERERRARAAEERIKRMQGGK